jgi:AraC family transcriptional regulator
MSSRGYGQHLAEALHAPGARSFVSHRTLPHAALAVTEVRRDLPDNNLTSPVPYDDAFMVVLNIRDWKERILWIDDKAVRARPFGAGTSAIFDLRRKYIGYGVSSFHLMTFYLPRSALETIAELDELRPTDDFGYDPCLGTDDAAIRDLGHSLSEAFRRPEEANALFVDHVTTALAAHVLSTYGLGWRRPPLDQGRLSQRQERRAKEMLVARLDGDLSTADLANECGLTLSGFRRAFATTVGKPPHRWQLEQRIAKAMRLMQEPGRTLDEVAHECKFVNEDHLRRVLRRLGELRRAQRISCLH